MAEGDASKVGYRSRFLDIIQAWLPVLTVVVGALWGLFTYITSQKEAEQQRLAQTQAIETQRLAQEREAQLQRNYQLEKDLSTRRIEAQRPFLQKQLDLYFETIQLVGKLISGAQPNTPEWKPMEERFWQLYWAELAMVEHGIVEQAMKEFGEQLKRYVQTPTQDVKNRLNVASYNLAHAIRQGIESAWSSNQPPQSK
jgi:hypothetical protein